jgi:hypothetical protein
MIGKLVLACVISLSAWSVHSVYAQESKAEGTKVGAHIKMTLFDFKNGKSNGTKGHEYAGMDFREMIVYISSELTDKVSIDLQPYFSPGGECLSTGATPRFGVSLSKTKTSSSITPNFVGWVKAAMKIVLPHEYELSAGIVEPRFTWDYGAELFWEEEYNGGKFSCNTKLGAMPDTGFELYKPFELGSVSFPAYLYLLNGGNEFNDNNSSPLVMIHAEPEIGAWKFQGSLARGTYDNANKYPMTRYSAGVSYEWQKFSIRSEWAGGNWEKSIKVATSPTTASLTDATPFGYYVKLFYKFAPWGRAMIHYDYADNNFNDIISSPGGEKFTTITPGLILNVAGGSTVQIQYDIADWRRTDKSSSLKFNRLTIGSRTTF